MQLWDLSLRCSVPYPQARKALADRQKELELKTQQLEIKLSNKIEEDIKKARRKSTQAGQSQGSKVKLPGHCGVAVSLRCLLLRGGEHCPSGSHMSVPVIHSVTKSGCGLLIRRDFSACQLYFSINGPALQKIQLSNVSSDFTTEGNKKTLKTLYVHRLLYRETQNLIEFLLGESSIFQPLNQHDYKGFTPPFEKRNSRWSKSAHIFSISFNFGKLWHWWSIPTCSDSVCRPLTDREPESKMEDAILACNHFYLTLFCKSKNCSVKTHIFLKLQ